MIDRDRSEALVVDILNICPFESRHICRSYDRLGAASFSIPLRHWNPMPLTCFASVNVHFALMRLVD